MFKDKVEKAGKMNAFREELREREQYLVLKKSRNYGRRSPLDLRTSVLIDLIWFIRREGV